MLTICSYGIIVLFTNDTTVCCDTLRTKDIIYMFRYSTETKYPTIGVKNEKCLQKKSSGIIFSLFSNFVYFKLVKNHLTYEKYHNYVKYLAKNFHKNIRKSSGFFFLFELSINTGHLPQ